MVQTARSSVVVRGALYDRLSSSSPGTVTVLVAPAGSGKTFLLRSWLDHAGIADRTAWVAVERGERDAQRFWMSLVDALRDAARPLAEIPRLEPSPDFDGNALVDRLIAGVERLAFDLVLVIDDLHELASPEALAQLQELIVRRPRNLRLVVATRHDPQLGLHRLRLAGQLLELRVVDLRFTLEETRQLLESSGVNPSTEAVALLHGRTEGWAAGLRLAALSLANHPDPERFLAEFSGSERTVADYLLAEVLEQQPAEVRELLLRTSIAERVNGPLADALTGAKGSEGILIELERSNAFVEALDGRRSWYRYHHLFSDLLRLELRRQHGDLLPDLHRTAAAWFAGHDFVIEAIRHYQAADDWSDALRLLADNVFSLTLDGQQVTTATLLDAFPPEMRSNPEMAWVLASDQLVRASLDDTATYLSIAERHAADVPADRRSAFEVGVATIRLALAARHGDYQSVSVEADALLENLDAEPEREPSISADARVLALVYIGIVELWSYRIADAERDLQRAVELARRIPRPRIEILGLGHLALVESLRSLERQRELAGKAVSVAEKNGWAADPVAAMALASMATADMMQGRMEAAREWLSRAGKALRPDLEPATALLVLFLEGVVATAEGRLQSAVETFRLAAAHQTRLVTRHVLTVLTHQFLVHLLIRLGDIAGARATLSALSEDEQAEGEIRIAAADLALIEGDPQAAIGRLRPVLDGTCRILGDYTMIQAWILEAMARDTMADPAGAEAAIEHALELAERNTLVFPFVMTAPRSVLERHPRHRTAHAALLSDVIDLLAGATLTAPPSSAEELTERLTDGELRVLRYLPSNLPAPEIAAELYVSTSTVKTHMRHIYEKLDVHGRSDAVRRARELGLLAQGSRRR